MPPYIRLPGKLAPRRSSKWDIASRRHGSARPTFFVSHGTPQETDFNNGQWMDGGKGRRELDGWSRSQRNPAGTNLDISRNHAWTAMDGRFAGV